MLALVPVAAGLLTAAATAAPSLGAGSFTKIATPAGTTYFGYGHNLPVSGQASADLNGSTVDIVCTAYSSSAGVYAPVFASAVPVTSGTFNTVANVPTIPTNCRLRAIPAGVDVGSDYLGSYAGPILYTHSIVMMSDGLTTYGVRAQAEASD